MGGWGASDDLRAPPAEPSGRGWGVRVVPAYGLDEIAGVA